jgi:hypothetical protein
MSYRTEFDKMMQTKFNPSNMSMENYNAPPFPGERTQSDMDLQKTWCPTCPKKPYIEGYAPMYGFRTEFDKSLQAKWCPENPVN